jgi:hypothetical protein
MTTLPITKVIICREDDRFVVTLRRVRERYDEHIYFPRTSEGVLAVAQFVRETLSPEGVK